MLRPILTRLYFLALTLLLSLQVVTPGRSARAQEPATSVTAAEGIKFYQQGNFPEAIKQLEIATRADSMDADAWPHHTEVARRAGVTGSILLECVFGSDGEVKDILVIRALGYGLTKAAVDAAKRIKFMPAQKDGLPVSMYMRLEYNFNLY